jgi:hypothetical protein
MNKLILKIIFLSIAAIATLASCDNDPTLQSYIVDSSEKEGFISTSIPLSILGVDDSNMSEDARKAFNSVEKINFLVYPKTDSNEASFEKESETLNNILKGDQYKTLMSHNQDGMKAKFLYEGDKDSIDEIIVFGMADKAGMMGVARILGDDMNISSIMKMMKEFDQNDADPTKVFDMLKGMGIDLEKGDGEVDQDAVRAIMESRGIDTSEMEAFNKE